jgi:hypothetical protein
MEPLQIKTQATVQRMATEAARLRRVAHDRNTSAGLRTKTVTDLENTIAQFQQKIAAANDRLTAEREAVAREQGESAAATNEAEDLQAIVVWACEKNGWDVPRVPEAPAPQSQPVAAADILRSGAEYTPVCICMFGQPPRLDCPVHGDRPRRDNDDPPAGGGGLIGSDERVEEIVGRLFPRVEGEATRPDLDDPERAEAVTFEPQTWALLAVGVWLAGWGARARHRHGGGWRVLPHRKGSLAVVESRRIPSGIVGGAVAHG